MVGGGQWESRAARKSTLQLLVSPQVGSGLVAGGGSSDQRGEFGLLRPSVWRGAVVGKTGICPKPCIRERYKQQFAECFLRDFKAHSC